MVDGISDAEPGLFGWVPAPAKGQGRPAYLWTKEKSNKVMCLFAARHTVKDVAAVLGCDAKTFRRVFSREVKYREIAMLILRSGMMATLVAEAEGGSVSAIKHLDKMLAAEKMRVESGKFASDVKEPAAKAASKPKGLKETRRENAYTAGVGDDEWGTLLHGSVATGAPN